MAASAMRADSTVCPTLIKKNTKKRKKVKRCGESIQRVDRLTSFPGVYFLPPPRTSKKVSEDNEAREDKESLIFFSENKHIRYNYYLV